MSGCLCESLRGSTRSPLTASLARRQRRPHWNCWYSRMMFYDRPLPSCPATVLSAQMLQFIRCAASHTQERTLIGAMGAVRWLAWALERLVPGSTPGPCQRQLHSRASMAGPVLTETWLRWCGSSHGGEDMASMLGRHIDEGPRFAWKAPIQLLGKWHTDGVPTVCTIAFYPPRSTIRSPFQAMGSSSSNVVTI